MFFCCLCTIFHLKHGYKKVMRLVSPSYAPLVVATVSLRLEVWTVLFVLAFVSQNHFFCIVALRGSSIGRMGTM